MITQRLLALAAGLLMCASSFAAEGALTVRMKSDEERTVMVSSRGVAKFDAENDFLIIGRNGESIAPVYPFEIFEDRFWSEPLSDEVYRRIEEGMEVRPVTLDKEPHWEIRYKGTEFLLYRKKKQVDELRKILETLLDRANAVKENLQAMGNEVLRDAERADEMREGDKLRREIESLLEDRNDINKKIEDLAPVNEKTQKKHDRLMEDLAAKDGEIAEKREELAREENRSGMSNPRMFDAMKNSGQALHRASEELHTLSTELYNALSHVEYIDENIQKPPP